MAARCYPRPIKIPVPFCYGKKDCYGFERDEAGNALFPSTNPAPDTIYNAADGYTIGEVHHPRHSIEGLSYILKDPLPDGTLRPTKLIISSPNMDWLPDISWDKPFVHMRADGRFWTHDFTLWPQWYFPDASTTAHLPFVRRKPATQEELAAHPYRYAWYDLTRADFVPAHPALSDCDMGQVTPEILQELVALRMALVEKTTALIASQAYTPDECEGMQACTAAVVTKCSCLASVQSFVMTLAAVTALQRHFLEALAHCEMLTVSKPRMLLPACPDSDVCAFVDRGLMGAVTAQLEVAASFARMGVPVWFVRSPAEVPCTVVIRARAFPRGLRDSEAVKDVHPDVAVSYTGTPCAARNRACQASVTQVFRESEELASAVAVLPAQVFRLARPPPPSVSPNAPTRAARNPLNKPREINLTKRVEP